MRTFFISILAFLLLVGHASMMESVNFQIPWDTVNSGGDDVSASETYGLHDTIGGIVSGTSSSSDYQAYAGYRAPEGVIDQLTFSLHAEEPLTATYYRTFSSAGKQVEVDDTSSFSAGNYIAVIQSKGFSQLVAVGKILSISGDFLIVDTWSGDQASMSATPSGSTNYVVRLGGSSVGFGTISVGAPYTFVTSPAITATVASGYTVYVQANQQLRSSAGNVIAAVTDGSVTTGSEEYGASVTGATAVNAGVDSGVTTTARVIQSSSSATSFTEDRVAMTYKISITSATLPGSYGQAVYYTLTPNF